MGWQEKIERYRAEQKQREEERQGDAKKALKEAQTRLFEILEQLGVRERLERIRDEIWQLGEVSVDLSSPPHVEISLKAKWPGYSPGYYQETGFNSDGYWISQGLAWIDSPQITVARKGLVLTAKDDWWGISDQYRIGDTTQLTISTNDHEKWDRRSNRTIYSLGQLDAGKGLEEMLIQDCIYREQELPYGKQKLADEQEAIKQIKEKGLTPPAGFEYLLELARKV